MSLPNQRAIGARSGNDEITGDRVAQVQKSDGHVGDDACSGAGAVGFRNGSDAGIQRGKRVEQILLGARTWIS